MIQGMKSNVEVDDDLSGEGPRERILTKMDDNKELTPKQRRVIPFLLAAPSIEEDANAPEWVRLPFTVGSKLKPSEMP